MTDFSRLSFAHFEVMLRDDGAPWELGRGAMGVTYRARDPQLRVDVALKVINPAQVGDAKAQALFLREARAAARVHHANVGTVVYLNQDPQNMFYAMEFIAGESLKDWLHSRVPLEPSMAIGLALQIARGLEAIHGQGVIHRDLKPGNIMVVRANKQRNESEAEAWQLKIIDFGLARSMAADVSETSAVVNTTGFRGTALYASPEQCEERRDLDGRTDLYALGCIIWEMLVGAPPFRANVHRELLNAHVAKPLPMQQISHLPASWQAVIARLLMKDREARFADAGEVIRALERMPQGAESEQGVSSLDVTTELPGRQSAEKRAPARLPKSPRRGGLALVVAGILAAAGFVGWKSGWLGKVGQADDWKARWESPTIAVLPFDALDGDKAEAKLTDELSGETIDQISKLPSVRVISRGAVMPYKMFPGGASRKRILEIDRELGGVTAILESSVQRQGDDLRIVSTLYDAKTEKRLWGYVFTRNWNDANAVGTELPQTIAQALCTRITAARRETPEQRALAGPTAADLYFKALPLDPRNESRKSMLDEAIAKDPKFAEAYAERSLFEFTAGVADKPYSPDELEKMRKDGIALNRKALTLDPNCVAALVHLSGFLDDEDDPKEAAALLAKGFNLGPNFMRANLFMGFNAASRDGAYEYVRRAHAIAPEIRRVMFFLLNTARDYNLPELADYWAKKIHAQTTDLLERNLLECQRLILQRDYDAALARLRLLPADLESFHFSVPEMTYDVFIGLGRYEEALALWEHRKADEEPRMRDLTRAELLLRLGRTGESREAAKRFVDFQTAKIASSKAAKRPVRMGYFYLAKGLEILGRQAESVEQLKKFVDGAFFPVPYPDSWVFRDNPEALAQIAKVTEKSNLIAQRIQEIEKSYSPPAPNPGF